MKPFLICVITTFVVVGVAWGLKKHLLFQTAKDEETPYPEKFTPHPKIDFDVVQERTMETKANTNNVIKERHDLAAAIIQKSVDNIYDGTDIGINNTIIVSENEKEFDDMLDNLHQMSE